MDLTRVTARGFAAAAMFALITAGCGDSSESNTTSAQQATSTTVSATTAAPATSASTTASTTTAAAAASAAQPRCPNGDVATGATKADYSLSSFKIEGPLTAKSGKVGITVKNTAGTHELAIVKGNAASQPRNANGSIDEPKLAAGAIVFRTARIAVNDNCTGVADLPAGAYTLVCNIEFNNAGTIISHPKQGMIADLVVS